MTIPELCERIQGAWLSRVISESTWGYPTVGALHVLAVVLFGGVVLLPQFRDSLRWLQRVGLTLVLSTGVLLFAAGAAGYYEKTFFRIKIGLLILIFLNSVAGSQSQRKKMHAAIALVLWATVIFASRGIAFF